jgi:hypothetical protein
MDARRRWVVASIVTMVLGASGVALAKLIEKVRTKGKIAVVVCRQSEAIVCDGGFGGTIQTEVFLNAEEFVTRSNTMPREATNNLFTTIVESNSCTFESSARFGSVPKAVRQQQGLRSADLVGTISLFDFDTGAPDGELKVDIELTGVGAITKDKVRDRFEFETPEGTVVVTNTYSKSRRRLAVGEGTIIVDGAVVDCTLEDGELLELEQGTRTVEHRR